LIDTLYVSFNKLPFNFAQSCMYIFLYVCM